MKKLSEQDNSPQEVLEILASTQDHATLKKCLYELENRTDFSVFPTAAIYRLAGELCERRLETPGIIQLMSATLESRLSNATESGPALNTLNLIAQYDRIPQSTLKTLDSMCSGPAAERMPPLSLATAASIFSYSKDYPRHRQVLSIIGLKFADKEIHHNSLLTVLLRTYLPLYVDLLPRMFAYKVLQYIQLNFERFYTMRPGATVLCFRLLQHHDVKLPPEFVESTVSAVQNKMETETGTTEAMLRVLVLLGDSGSVSRELSQKLLNNVSELKFKRPIFVLRLIEFITEFGLPVSAAMQDEIGTYIKENLTFFVELWPRRNSLMAYFAKLPGDGGVTAALIKEMGERSLTDMHTIGVSDAIHMATLFTKLPQTDVQTLVRVFNHLAVHFEQENSYRRLTPMELRALCSCVGDVKVCIPRILDGLRVYVDALSSGRIVSDPAFVTKSVAYAYSRCGCTPEQALPVLSKLEGLVTHEHVAPLSLPVALHIASHCSHLDFFPKVILEPVFERIRNDTLFLGDMYPDDKFRFFSLLSCVKVLQPGIPIPKLPQQTFQELQDIMISRICRLLQNSRSRALTKAIYPIVQDDSLLLRDVVSSNGYVINLALVADSAGQFVPWSSIDGVSDLDVSKHAYTDVDHEKLAPVLVDVKRITSLGFQPIAIVSLSPVLTVLNQPTVPVGMMTSAFRVMEKEGWQIILVYDEQSKNQKADSIKAGLHRILSA